jgi:hypothetical protein
VESADGRLVIRVTNRLGEVHHALGSEPVKAPAHSTAVHVSAAQRYYGALLLRQAQHEGQQQLLAYVLPSMPAAGAGKDASGPPAAVPAVLASGAEGERAAAVRWAACLSGWPAAACGACSCTCELLSCCCCSSRMPARTFLSRCQAAAVPAQHAKALRHPAMVA